MNLDISLVPYGKISYLIPHLVRYLNESESWAMGRANIDDIRQKTMGTTEQVKPYRRAV